MIKRPNCRFFVSPLMQAILVLSLLTLTGCSSTYFMDLSPSGPVSRSIDDLFWLTIALMSLVIIPVFVLTFWIVNRYRASKQHPEISYGEWHEPMWLEWLIWLFPAFIVVCLSVVTWVSTHRLDPYRPLTSAAKPVEIQAVALDWKWLFIYPEQKIASVNQVAFPVNRPINFRITSGTVMNSFFIPSLAGQIYAMAGMETQMHLLADKTGSYFGQNSQYSGQGFPFQYFQAIAVTDTEFKQWLAKAKHSGETLDMKQYQELAKPSIRDKVEYFGSAESGLFGRIIDQFSAHGNENTLAIEEN